MNYKLPINGKWYEFSDQHLADMRKSGEGDIADHMMFLLEQYERNPVSMFLPHGRVWQAKQTYTPNGRMTVPASTYPKEWGNDGAAFLNDWTHDLVFMLAPNQVGKTKIATVKSCLYLIPCDPNWMIYQHHGVVRREWDGPKILVAASYSWDNVETLWQRYRETMPRHELRNFSPQWGKYEGETGRQRDLTFGDGKPKDVELACGSVIKFLCYTQQQMHWEGFSADALHADEQIPEEKFIGWARGTTTRGLYTPCWGSLTGHILEDRPDTGASGWMKRKLYDGKDTKGRTMKWYGMDVESTPDAIISPEKKQQLWRQWADPSVARSEKDERAAVARYWGGWEEGSGLVFDEFDRAVHVIPPLWQDGKAPRNWTKWRVIDFGDAGVTACAWLAVSPSGIAVCYRLLYEKGFNIAQTCKEIIERSHNKQVELYKDASEIQGAVFTFYEEQQCSEQFYATLLDSRSCSQRQMGNTLEDIFGMYGVQVTPACGQKNEIQIPRLKEWLSVDRSKPHILLKKEDGTPLMGAPKLYIFDNCHSLIEEIEAMEKDKDHPGRLAKHCEDHAIDTLKYWASDDPRYFGDDWNGESKPENPVPTTRFTGY